MKQILTVFIGLIVCQSGWAQTFTGNTSNLGTRTLFSYQLTNTAAPVLFSVDIVLRVPVVIADVSAPSGWTPRVDEFGDTWVVNWTNVVGGVVAGGSEVGFTIVSGFPTGSAVYQITDEELGSYGGQTVAPVPEPASVCALGIGTLCLWRRSSKRK